MEGYPCLLSSGALDSPVRHRIATVACPVRDFLPNQAQPTVAPRGRLAHRTVFGAHWTVRCTQPTVGAATCRALIARTTVDAGAVGSPDSPVNYSHVALLLFPRATSLPRMTHRTVRWIIVVRLRQVPRAATSLLTNLAHRTSPSAPPDSPVCQAELKFGCTEPSLFHFFSPFVTVSSTRTNTLVLKKQYTKSRNIPCALICTSHFIWHIRT
jgi:hypothetical protein